jgi:hypothetical protein
MLAACAGSNSSTPAQRPTEEARVDPTVPSWLPESCIAYHKVVVQTIDCQAVDQTKRDEIQNTFDTTSVSWKAEQNADKAKLDEIGATCTTATASVRADLAHKCV